MIQVLPINHYSTPLGLPQLFCYYHLIWSQAPFYRSSSAFFCVNLKCQSPFSSVSYPQGFAILPFLSLSPSTLIFPHYLSSESPTTFLKALSAFISTLDAIVGTHVDLEVDFLSEALRASRASIGPLPGVDTDVSLEVGGKEKFFATHVTGVRRFLPLRNRNRALAHLKETSRSC